MILSNGFDFKNLQKKKHGKFLKEFKYYLGEINKGLTFTLSSKYYPQLVEAVNKIYFRAGIMPCLPRYRKGFMGLLT